MKTSDQDECVLCCREISIYAVGACDHPVCYECSARMRVLCETNECPICRSEMPFVICTLERRPFFEIFRKYTLIDRKYQIKFENADVQRKFHLLLENRCKECDAVFNSFSKLKDHVRREHSLRYCELCAENLKIFPFERKTYDNKQLTRHKRSGDPDETSHRGHPLCEFCDQRYVDNDELFRHLRREHYFCHFCDADGKHEYYEDYDYLKVHFRKEHYLCEEGDCANEQFTGAFRSEIDLKAHIAVHHSKNKSKAEAKQARMLELEFSFAPHPNRPSANSSPRGNRFGQHRRQNIEEKNQRQSKTTQPVEAKNINTESTLDFPYLSEDAKSNSVAPTMMLHSYGHNSVPRQQNKMSTEDFPALVSTRTNAMSNVNDNQGRKFNLSIHRQNKTPNVSIHLSKKSDPNSRDDDNRMKASWNTKKKTFEDEFPKLETKPLPPPVTYTNVVNMTVQDSVQSKPQPAIDVVSDPNSGSRDQFIIIKSKSRKKKHNKAVNEDKGAENNEDNYEKEDQSNSILLNGNLNSFSNGRDGDDKFKKNLFRPSNTKPNYDYNSWQQKVSFGKDDFPPLAPSEALRRPPGFKGPSKKPPPPGYNVDSGSIQNSAPLNITLSSIARQIDVINKNSSAETKIPHSKWLYKKPHTYNTRNESLISRINELSLLEEFKILSCQFRKDEITAATYYEKCLEILSKEDFFDMFPDLVSLLPDINKQQELLAVHKKYQNNSGAVPKQKLFNNQICVCDICYQVLIESDFQNHQFEHEIEFNK